MDTFVLVEGISDRIALETLAARRGRDLESEGVTIVPMGGAHAIGRFLTRFAGMRVVGLCDEQERDVFLRAGMAPLAFEVCVEDLEDELIRALGAEVVEDVLDANGHLDAFRTFQRQPAWRSKRVEAQLRRFLCASDRRKLRYARFLVDAAIDRNCVPSPLDAVLTQALNASNTFTA
ncbi:MAG TPA: TOPRIM nucleotidyl transferase/hydrolase domain-containing protein [Gaiellaceae bacterium]|nr:TOPRIM nucleotidyl transferase/hydrolase domain-containing protein [Gaiellaceae bacterium]